METLESVIQVLKLNGSFFIYLLVFSFFLTFISRALMAPYYEKLKSRNKETEGKILKSEELQKKALETKKQYEEKLTLFNQKFQSQLKKRKDQILEKNQKEINKAFLETKEKTRASKKTLRAEFDLARKELMKEAPKLAENLSIKLIS